MRDDIGFKKKLEGCPQRVEKIADCASITDEEIVDTACMVENTVRVCVEISLKTPL